MVEGDRGFCTKPGPLRGEWTLRARGRSAAPSRAELTLPFLPGFARFASLAGSRHLQRPSLQARSEQIARTTTSPCVRPCSPSPLLALANLPPSSLVHNHSASLGALLRSSTDFHLSQSAMEIAYRTVPPFNPKSSSTSSDNPKKQWIDQLFPVELFGTDTEMFREKFYKLTGKTYYEEMTEILKLISLANIKRFVLPSFSLTFLPINSTRLDAQLPTVHGPLSHLQQHPHTHLPFQRHRDLVLPTLDPRLAPHSKRRGRVL